MPATKDPARRRGPRVQWYNAQGDRWCGGCGTYQPVLCFRPVSSSSVGDGLDSYCRTHRKAAYDRHYQRHQAQQIAKARARTLRRRAHDPEDFKRQQRDYTRERRAVQRLSERLADDAR